MRNVDHGIVEGATVALVHRRGVTGGAQIAVNIGGAWLLVGAITAADAAKLADSLVHVPEDPGVIEKRERLERQREQERAAVEQSHRLAAFNTIRREYDYLIQRRAINPDSWTRHDDRRLADVVAGIERLGFEVPEVPAHVLKREHVTTVARNDAGRGGADITGGETSDLLDVIRGSREKADKSASKASSKASSKGKASSKS
ncbi:MAG: hypothetical protein RIB46_01250 [Pseudomonadales bacterium]